MSQRQTAKRKWAEQSTQATDDDDAVKTGVKILRGTDMAELTERHLRQVACRLGAEWEALATYLGFIGADVYKIRSESPYSTDDQIFTMLVSWSHRNPNNQVATLSEHLIDVGRMDLAQYVLGFSQEEDARKQQRFAATMLCDKHKSKREFFCETCQELICQYCSVHGDHQFHQYATVEVASGNCKRLLKDQLQISNRDLAKIDQELKSISEAAHVLSSRFTEAQHDVHSRVAQVKEEVDAEGNRLVDELKQLEKDHKQTLNEKRKTMTELLRRKSQTVDVAEDAMHEGSNSDFLVLYPGIKKRLDMLSRQRPPKIYHKRWYLRFKSSLKACDVDLGEVEMERTWQLCHEFGKRGKCEGEFEEAKGIAAAADPDEIAVTDARNNRLVICNNQGETNSTIKIIANDVVAASNQWICADPAKMMVYHRDTMPAYEFHTVQESEVCKTGVWLVSVAVMPNGNIIVGDVRRKVLTEHRILSDKAIHVRTIQVKIRPYHLAVLSDGRIVVSDEEEGLVEIVDVSKDTTVTVGTIKPTIDGKPVTYTRGVCSNSSGIYIALDTDKLNTGHIHQYDFKGQFVCCVAHGLHAPRGIEFTADRQQLAVADYYSVKMFHKV